MACIEETLRPFVDLTDGLSGEKMVTVSSVIPMLNHVRSLCTPGDGDDASALTWNVRKDIWEYIGERYQNEN